MTDIEAQFLEHLKPLRQVWSNENACFINPTLKTKKALAHGADCNQHVHDYIIYKKCAALLTAGRITPLRMEHSTMLHSVRAVSSQMEFFADDIAAIKGRLGL